MADESPVFGVCAGCVSEFEIQKIKTEKALIISREWGIMNLMEDKNAKTVFRRENGT